MKIAVNGYPCIGLYAEISNKSLLAASWSISSLNKALGDSKTPPSAFEFVVQFVGTIATSSSVTHTVLSEISIDFPFEKFEMS